MNRIIKTKINKSGYRQKFITDSDNEVIFKILVIKNGPIFIAFPIHVTLYQCPQSSCYIHCVSENVVKISGEILVRISSNFLHSISTSICIRKCNKNWG